MRFQKGHKIHLGKKFPKDKYPNYGMRNKKHSEESKEKMKQATLGDKHTEESKKKISEALKGRILSEEHKKKLSEAKKGIKLSEEHRKKLSENRKRNPNRYWLGKKRPKKTIEKISKTYKKKWQNPEYYKKMSKVRKRLWQNPEHWKKMAKAFTIKPNKPEIFLTNLLNKILPNEYKYVGDGQFILGGKCPDFMNINGQKKLIELFGNWWHRNDNPQDRINYFKEHGFDTLVIWESELKNEDLGNRIINFNVKEGLEEGQFSTPPI